jgi:hypothetical protein
MGAWQDMPAQESKPPDSESPTRTDQTTQPSESSAQKSPATTPPASTKPKKKKTHKKKPTPTSDDGPPKVVVRNGSTTDPTVKLTPAETDKQTSNQMHNVDQLLAGTDANLKLISARTLDATQQETVKQIRTYMDQARKAVDSGDVEQGKNLAFKAHLLSDDLVKH